MDFFNTHSILTIKIFLILTFFNGKLNSVTLSDLNRVCVYYFPFDTEEQVIIPPNNFCTSVATYGDSDYGFHPPYENFDSTSFKGNLSYVYIYDNVRTLRKMKRLVKDHSVDHFVDKLNQLIDDKQIDVLVFDIADTEFGSHHHYSEHFQNNLKSFLNRMKETHQNMLFGLRINRRAKEAKKVFNPEIIGDSIDFYVVRSFDYTYCKYRNDQSDMAKPPTPKQLTKTIKRLEKVGFEAEKLFITIQIDVKTLKNRRTIYPKNWSYSWLCQSDAGKNRKYCRGTLQNFYLQGKVVYDNKLPGVFIEGTDCDDYKNNCQCGYFPVAHVISDGMNGYPEDKNLTDCKTFGILPKDRKTQ